MTSVSDRDQYFEALLDQREESLMLRGIPFLPSTVAAIDPQAYVELRLDLLSDTTERVADRLSPESLERLRHLARLLPMKRVTPFVGAGFSAPAGMPTWGSFLEKVATGRLPDDEVQVLLKECRYEELADNLIRTCGIALFDERLTVFDGTTPSSLHHLLPGLFKGSAFTTNFDVLVEKVYEQSGQAFDLVVQTPSQWEGIAAADTQSARVLVKVHGDYRLPKTRVFSVAEYDMAYADNGPLMRDLTALFAGHAVVFLGCSLASDRVMDVALKVATNVDRGGPRHYALLPIEGAQPDPARERFLNDRHIFPIWYPSEDKHRLLGEILWVLSSQAGEL